MEATELRDAFRVAMRRWAATVCVITASPRVGMAATSVTSLTLDPPALLVCVNQNASIHPRLTMGARLCVNVLGGDHGDLSMAFGGGRAPEERFMLGDWEETQDGIPWLRDAQSNLFARVDGLTDYGTHTIVVGRVDAVRQQGGTDPLIYGDGRYARL